MEQENKREIPYVKPVKVGNYKLWRSKKTIGEGVGKYNVIQINISNLECSWQVKIPETVYMYSILYELYSDGGDECLQQLQFILDNMQYVTMIPNGYYHRALRLIAMIYANPTLLKKKDKDHKALMKDVKALVAGFLEWRKEYDRQEAENAPTNEEMEQDARAFDILEDEILMGQSETEDEDGKTD